MKKVLFMSAIAAMALASCTSDEYVGQKDGPTLTESINFGTFSQKTTRAGEFTGTQAAEKLNNNFIVYGFKYYGTEPIAAGTGTGQVGNPEEQQTVFDRYNVNYQAGTANTTESNTADWEYVGFDSHGTSPVKQTIKYWDYETTGYVYSAVSGTGITADKIESVANGPVDNGDATITPMAWSAPTLTREEGASANKFDKGWVVTIPEGGSLSDLYASERVDVTKASDKYQQTVSLKFYNMGAKIRFAMYETVPGYSIQINKFYYTNSGEQNSETNFAIDAAKNFTTLKTDAENKLIVTYYNSGTLLNHPKVTPLSGSVNTANFGLFGTNIQPTEEIGTTSVEATYDQADKSYTDIIPCDGGQLTLKVDYTLTSTDGSKETIHVKGATAKVPANFTEWKANFAYTYLFKISDNTNGTTGTGSDPKGLYPITFDACVVGTEDGIQETITSVSEPSITTYAQGRIVTENDEYTEGNVYFNVMKDAALCNLVNHGEVFEVHNFGTIEKITEEVVKNWRNNFCVLLPVTTNTAVTTVPLSDGTTLSFAAGELGVFAAKAGKTYAIHYNTTDSWKVVKVAGTEDPTVEYSQTISSTEADYTITAKDDPVVYTLKASSPAANTMVIGANANMKIYDSSSNDVTTNFNITDNFDGTYNIIMTDAAIAAGANGTYTVKFNNTACTQNFKVTLTYALSNTLMTIVAGNATGDNTTLTVNTVATDGDVINTNKEIKVEKTATGTYKITAAADAAHNDYTLTIGGQTLTVTVDTYAFADDLVITKAQTGTSSGTLTLQKNGATASGTHTLTGANGAIATHTETDGVYTFTANAGGSFVVTYENAKATVTVNAYTFTAADAKIAANTGSTTLTLTKNTKVENAEYAKVTVKKNGSNVTTGFKLTTNGQKLTFGNVSAPGIYTFEYRVNTVLVATAKVVVGEETLTASATSISSPSGTSTLTYKVAGDAVDGGAASVNTGVDGTNWTITNNGNGTYTFTGLVAGTYTVTIGGKSVTITVTA